MKTVQIALPLLLLAAGGAHAQLVEPSPAPILEPGASRGMRPLAPYTPFHAGVEGLPPADPQALDLYRPDLKLHAGVDLGPYLSIESKFTNPGYREGMHFRGPGPRRADPMPLAAEGFDLDLASRVSVPVDERLDAFGTLGMAASVRKLRHGKSTDFGPIGSVGATYKLERGRTATLEVPLRAMTRTSAGGMPGLGANLTLGF
ncbi:MAG: hypothetical protein ACLGI6_09175 [Gammaproteobacteria bacterium]